MTDEPPNSPAPGHHRRPNQTALIGKLVAREISETTKGSGLGFAWLLLGPLLSMTLYVIVFGVLFGGRFTDSAGETSLQFALGVYVGLTFVNLINESVGKAPFLIIGKINFVKRIVFPLQFLPLVQVTGTTFKMLVNILLWIGFALAIDTATGSLFLLPVLLLPVILLALGLTWGISALGVYFRDIQQLVPVLTQIVFWSSGVFYGANRVMEVPAIWSVLKWNPVFLAVENARNLIIWNTAMNWGAVLYLYGTGIGVAVLGFTLFMRTKSGFSELV